MGAVYQACISLSNNVAKTRRNWNDNIIQNMVSFGSRRTARRQRYQAA
jgi:hypothetical protein